MADDAPEFVTARALPGSGGQRRLAILRRADGRFTLAEQYRYRSEFEGRVVAEGWQTIATSGLYAELGLAEAELRAICPSPG